MTMIEIDADESRALGVIIEKALTTPDQYPLSLNAVVNGANQKNNRDPVLQMTEDQIFAALERLRAKGLVMRVEAPGNRVHKYRQEAANTLKARTGELAILAELLLRGPQTLGELRGRASRMHPMDSLDVTRDLLRALMERPEPLAKQIPPTPGSRAERYIQLLSPDSRSAETSQSETSDAEEESGSSPQVSQSKSDPELESRVAELEEEVQMLKTALRRLASAIGEADPLA